MPLRIMVDCIEQTGKELNVNNQDIVKYLCGIEEERKTLEIIIQKQYQERKKIEADIERLTYKLCLINKSLSMRIKAKNNYDKTIEEIKGHYHKLVDSSNKLKQIVEKSQQELDDIMNKKTGTSGPDGEEVQMLYVKATENPGPEDCSCTYTPTKEQPAAPEKQSSTTDTVSLPSPAFQNLATGQNSTGDASRTSAENVKRVTNSLGHITDPSPATWNKPSPPVAKDSSFSPAEPSDFLVSNTMASKYNFDGPRRTSREPSTSREDKSRPSSQVQGPTSKRSTIENEENVTLYDLDKRKPLPTLKNLNRNDEKSKNLLLSRLKSSVTKDPATVASVATPRQSKTVEETKESTLDHRMSDVQPNKLQKRSLHEILSADSSHDAKNVPSQIL